MANSSLPKDTKKFVSIIDLLICLVVVFIFFVHTLNRPWIFYDERIIYDELAVPIPTNFSEILEIISNFGTTGHLSSLNYLYSSISVNRASLLGVPFLLLLGLFFKKNVFLYHLLNLIFHLVNTSLVFLILRRGLPWQAPTIGRWLVILMTLIWALHPLQVESVLLTTNLGANLSYSIFFLIFYDFLKNRERNNSLLRSYVLPFCFLIPMLLNEYIIALPFILFAYAFIENYQIDGFKNLIKKAYLQSKPYLIGLVLYLVYFLFSSYKFIQTTNFNPFVLFLERIFWLSPQIIVNYLKLIFFPKILSIDQAALVHLGKSLFDKYSLFCTLFVLFLLLLPIFLPKRDFKYKLMILIYLFFLSLLPFSQIFSQTYCLTSERYLYTPLFFIVFGLAHLIFSRRDMPWHVSTLVVLSCVLIVFGTKSYIRTHDWKNNTSLIESTIKTSPNYLYKGARTNDLGDQIFKKNKQKAEKYFKLAQNYFYKAIKDFEKEKEQYKNIPLILKSYGLDYNSLLVKTAYFICIEPFNKKSEDKDSYFKALEIFTPYLKYQNSFDPRTLELYANLLVKTDNPTEAKEVFLYAYKKYPTSSFILISLIRFSRDIEKDLINARIYLTKALSLYPYSRDILYEAVKYYYLANNLNEYTKYSYFYGLRTHSKFYYHEALAGYLTLNKLNLAKKTIDRLFSSDQFDPRTLYLSSGYYIKKRDYKKALALLDQAYSIVRGAPNDKQLSFDITNTLAHLYLALGNSQQGFYYAKEALSFADGNPSNVAKIKKLVGY